MICFERRLARAVSSVGTDNGLLSLLFLCCLVPEYERVMQLLE